MKKKEAQKFDLNAIKDPSFLKNLSLEELNLLCAQIREEIIDKTSLNGGHVSSNLGVVELTVALHLVFDFKKDKLLLDVGHQCYTHKILTGRSLENLRKKDGISGFEKRQESEYDCFEAGHSSTSLSSAYGMGVVRDLKKENYDVVALIGDGALSSGLAFEGLNNIGLGNSKIIIVLNDNEMSISKATGGFARYLQSVRTSISYNKRKKAYQKIMCKTRFGLWLYRCTSGFKNRVKRLFLSTNIFDTLGFAYIGPIDGHDIRRMEKAFLDAKKSNRSVVIHVQTTKGKGYKYAEHDKVGIWHGVPPFNKETGEFKTSSANPSWSEEIASILDESLNNHQDAVLINPAMIQGSKLGSLFDKYKDRCFDVGICESHAITMASGVALNGYHPIVSIYSTFMQRAFDEIQQDLARMELNATLLIDRAGLVGEDGETHQGIFDEAMLYTMPNVTISMPSSIQEAKVLLEESYQNHQVFAIRYPRANIRQTEDSPLFSYGQWIYYNRRKKDAIISYGPIINELKEKFPNCDIINAIYQKPIIKENIDKLLHYRFIYIYCPYSTKDGFINNLIETLSLYYYKGKVSYIAVPEKFIKASSQSEQVRDLKLSLDDLKILIEKRGG